MGNQQSMSSDNQFTASVSAFTSNNSNFTLPSNLTDFTNSIKKFITFHKNLQSVYTYYTENVLTTFTHKINNSVSILDALLQQQTAKNTNTKQASNSKSTDESKQNKDALKQLFNLGVFKTKIKDNENLYIEVDTSFHKIHSQFISNLEKLAIQKPIVSEYSVNTLDEQVIKKQFLKNIETINSVLTRILFYRYCTLLNNYIMHLYAIYAKSQMEVFTSKIIKKKKQEDFVVVQKLLQDAIDKTNVNYNVKISNAIKSLNQKITKGGTIPNVVATNSNNTSKSIPSNIANIKVLLESSFQSFVQSNNQTNEFFTSINNIIDKKIETIKTDYSNMDKTIILNTNITEALKKLESQIRESTLTPTSENLNAVVANITNVEEEKETLKKYLQMIAIQSNADKLNTALTAQHIY